jgi:DNA-binding protein
MSDRTPGDKASEGAKRPAMTRSELIRRLADAYPVIHRRDIAASVEIFFAEIAAGLARGERVECEVSALSRPRQGEHAVPVTPGPAPPSRLGQEIIWFSTPVSGCAPTSTLVPQRGRAGRCRTRRIAAITDRPC